MIERRLIPELDNVPTSDLDLVQLSASGATIVLEKHDIYIEAASLVAGAIEAIRDRKTGGLLMDLMSAARP